MDLFGSGKLLSCEWGVVVRDGLQTARRHGRVTARNAEQAQMSNVSDAGTRSLRTVDPERRTPNCP